MTFMKHLLLSLLLTLFHGQALCCMCIPPPLMDTYQGSDFVAVVKILKSTPDPKDDSYRTVEIETINQYKATPTTSLRVNTSAHSDCAFSIPVNSIWLVFARKGENGVLGFGACSGSRRTEPAYDAVAHPRAAQNYQKNLETTVAVLSYLKTNELENSNPYHLNINDIGLYDTTIFRGFENQNKFAVYELDINEDLSIGKITTLLAFDNPKLDRLFSQYLYKKARVNSFRRKTIPTKTKLFVMFHYYTAQGNAPSSVSQDLWLW